MPITSQISEDKKILTIAIIGKFEISVHKIFTEAYKDRLNTEKIILDMEQVTYLDSTALGMMLVMRERFGGIKANIEIVNVKPYAAKIFQISNFTSLFKIK